MSNESSFQAHKNDPLSDHVPPAWHVDVSVGVTVSNASSHVYVTVAPYVVVGGSGANVASATMSGAPQSEGQHHLYVNLCR